jgi:hypothetical protein
VRHVCTFCGSFAADEPNALWCRVCVTLVDCEQCFGRRRAPPEIGLCDRCRRLNAIDVRRLFAAALAVSWLDLEHLARAQVTHPHRVPLSGLEAAALARAARPLQAAALALPVSPLLRDVLRKGPKRAERAPKEVNDEDAADVPAVSGRAGRVRR